MVQVSNLIRILWHYLREACGENDYARYRARALQRGTQPLPRDEFYVWQLREKYSRINRCC
jgi:hypothetical protein